MTKKKRTHICDICLSKFIVTDKNWQVGQGWTMNCCGVLVCRKSECFQRANYLNARFIQMLAPGQVLKMNNGMEIRPRYH